MTWGERSHEVRSDRRMVCAWCTKWFVDCVDLGQLLVEILTIHYVKFMYSSYCYSSPFAVWFLDLMTFEHLYRKYSNAYRHEERIVL